VLSALREPFAYHDVSQPGFRVALIAPALDCEFAHRIGCFSSSQNLVDRSVVFFNQSDRVIKLSELVCRRRYGRQTCSFEDAVMHGGISLGSVEKIEVGCEAGKKHSIVGYSESVTLRNAINGLVNCRSRAAEAAISSP